ncbi:hypothetical protein D3C73_1583900 [compost metagenome]
MELLVIIVIWKIVPKVNAAIIPLPPRSLNSNPLMEYAAVVSAMTIGRPLRIEMRNANVI